MACLGTTTFTGKSGKTYRFKTYAWGAHFRKVSGVYVIGSRARGEEGQPNVLPLFVGSTEDFSQPFRKHRKAQVLNEQGANCICLQSDALEESRLAKQRDLIAGLQPACND